MTSGTICDFTDVMLLLSCEDLTRGYDAEPLFDGVAFELFAGERVGLVGPNGAGKTTLLKVLAGLDQPDRGDVRLHAGARIGLLQQHPEFPKAARCSTKPKAPSPSCCTPKTR